MDQGGPEPGPEPVLILLPVKVFTDGAFVPSFDDDDDSNSQGCSLVLNVSVSRRFFGTSHLVSVLKVERLGLESLEKSHVSASSRS